MWQFGGTVVWVIFMGANFRGKSEKTLFIILNLRLQLSPGTCYCTSNEVIYYHYTLPILLDFFLSLSYFYEV
jgi:hypothetical protein